MRILILLLYWERPIMVKNALKSVLRANEHYNDWELAFIDDSSSVPGRPVCEEILGDHLDKIRFYNTDMTPEEKLKTGGMVGREMNQAIKDSDADIIIMLCDDDAVCLDYFLNLSNFFTNKSCLACHSHAYQFNPAFEDIDHVFRPAKGLNHMGEILLAGNVDASQVAWRREIHKKNIWFNKNQTVALDFSFYSGIDRLGKTEFSGFYSQFKGIHPTRLVLNELHEFWDGKSIDSPDCEIATSVSELCTTIESYIKYGNLNEARRICEQSLKLHLCEPDLYKLLMVASIKK